MTREEEPNDYDGVWEVKHTNLGLVDQVLLDLSDGRAAMKAKYLGELFPSTIRMPLNNMSFLDFFQRDRLGMPKGMIHIDLGTLP